MAESNRLGSPDSAVCLRPSEPDGAYGEVVVWSCGYGCDES